MSSIHEALEKEKKYCSYGDTVHYSTDPRLFKTCEGSFLYDYQDTPFLDLQMWYSAVNFGYKNQRLTDALVHQINNLPQLASQYLHLEKIELAEAICQSIEERTGLKGRVHFNVGGSQSVDDSLKVVRNTTGKNMVFAYMGGYHGRSLGATSITSSYRYRRRYGHFSDRAEFIPYPYCFRCPYDMKPESCNQYCVSQFDKLFDTEYNSVWDPKAEESEFGALYVETIQGTGGYFIPPKDYFGNIEKITKERNILMVVDEIQMGFYRTGKLWSFEHFDIKPDIVFGKALTNGLNPLAGLWAREDLISPEIFPPGSTHSTFSSNPLGTAVGLEVMKMLKEKDYESMVMEKGEYFLQKLQPLKNKYPEIGHVDGLGLALRVEICEKDGFTPNQKLAQTMFNEGLKGDLMGRGQKMGLVLDIGGYYKNVITLAPSLEISREEIDLGCDLLDQLFARCTV
jgi:4-aminobutyrate aminotransferase / (S)-3-amino-2-methylpropionate transaminase / 5-aminovalerate transaminase